MTGAPQGRLYEDASWATGQALLYAVGLDGTAHTTVDVNANAANTGSSYSTSAWVKFNSTSGTQTVLSEDGLNVSGYYVQLVSGTLYYTVRSADSGSSTATSITGPTLTAGTWYQITTTYNASTDTMSLYVDGSLSGTASFSTPWAAVGQTEIGRGLWGGLNVDQTTGDVDQVYYYDRALSATEVSELYAL